MKLVNTLSVIAVAAMIPFSASAEDRKHGFVSGDDAVSVELAADIISTTGGALQAGALCFLRPGDEVVYVTTTGDNPPRIEVKKKLRLGLPKDSGPKLMAIWKRMTSFVKKDRCPVKAHIFVSTDQFDAWKAKFEAEAKQAAIETGKDLSDDEADQLDANGPVMQN